MQSPFKRQRVSSAHDQPCTSGQHCTLAEYRNRAAGYLSSRLCCGSGRRERMSMDIRPSLQAVQTEIEGLLKATIEGRENASFLVVGESGCGKTLVIERALHQINTEHNKDPNNRQVGFVRVSGCLHSEERVAFLEMARQLCMTFNLTFEKGASYDENLTFLKRVLTELQRSFKSVVFVIDGVEGFLKAAKQTLLYNLLDSLTSSQVQAAVLGVSCCWDLQSMMEKRVRSRFSQRRIVVPGLSAEPVGDSPTSVLHTMLTLPPSFEPQQRTLQYNSSVSSILQDKEVKASLQRLCSMGVTAKELSAVALGTLVNWQLSGPSTPLLPVHGQAAMKQLLAGLDGRVAALTGCTLVELAVLVAARRVEEKGQAMFNFEMVFEEISKVKQEQLGCHFKRPAVWRGFKEVTSLGLVQFMQGRPEARGLVQSYLPAQLQVSAVELEQGLEQHPHCPDMMKRWLKGEHAMVSSYALG